MAIHLENPPTSASLSESARSRRRWIALAVICLAELLVVLDNTIVNVALPDIGLQLRTSVSGLQWVVDAYTLSFAGLLLTFGNIGDRFGRKRIMLVGLLGVGAASAAGALGHSLTTVLTARAMMGVFAAAVFPATLALITNLFPERSLRTAAIGVWTAMAGVAIAIGPLSGGWLLDRFSWHSVFWINVPVALTAVLAAVVLVPESRAAQPGPLDPIGIVSSILGITALVWAIIEGPRHGWLSPVTLGVGLTGALLLAVFIWWERRTATPLLDLRLFGNRRFSLPALAIAVIYFSMFGFLFLITQYYQGILEYTPLHYGIAALPFAGTLVVAAPTATLLSRWVGTTVVVVTGLLSTGFGLYLGGLVDMNSSYLDLVLPAMIAMSIGIAFVQGPATESIMASVALDEAGAGSAVNDTTREIGGTLGVAVLGSVVASYYARINPRIDSIPNWLMTPDQKDYARASVLAAAQIHRANTAFPAQRDNLVLAMKTAALHGSHIASLVAAVAVVVCALVVAVLLPHRS